MALALAISACPLACCNTTGWLGVRALSTSWLGPFFLVPSATFDPFAGWRCACAFGGKVEYVVPTPGVQQVEVHQTFAQTGEMAVPFNDTGHGEGAHEVDHPGAVAPQRKRTLVGAYVQDAVAAHGQGCGALRGAVGGEKTAVYQQQIGGVVGAGRGARPTKKDNKGKNKRFHGVLALFKSKGI
jgi:hypothetical protein